MKRASALMLVLLVAGLCLPAASTQSEAEWRTLIDGSNTDGSMRLNGTLTVDVENGQHATGPFARQYGIFNAESPDPQATLGTLRIRSLQIR